MKKIIAGFLCLFLLILIMIIYMVSNDNKYLSNLEYNIIKNTDIKSINYVNKYDNYYIVEDDDYLYLFNNSYELIYKKDVNLIYINDRNYDIIYKDDTLMYFNDYIKDGKLVYEYYDINTYEMINRVFVGGDSDE